MAKERRLITCPYCGGKGWDECPACDGRGTWQCARCEGTGRVTLTLELSAGPHKETTEIVLKCPRCAGHGKQTCDHCRGAGRVLCGICEGREQIYADELAEW